MYLPVNYLPLELWEPREKVFACCEKQMCQRDKLSIRPRIKQSITNISVTNLLTANHRDVKDLFAIRAYKTQINCW